MLMKNRQHDPYSAGKSEAAENETALRVTRQTTKYDCSKSFYFIEADSFVAKDFISQEDFYVFLLICRQFHATKEYINEAY